MATETNDRSRAADPRRPAAGVLSNVALSISVVTLSLAVIEAGLRLFYRELPDRVAYGMFMPDRELGAVPSPGYRDATTTINKWGMRGGPRPLAPPPGGLRVLVLGDSFVFGSEQQDETIVSFLEPILQASLPGRAVEVLNGGVPGYDTIQEAAWYRRFARPLKPQIVVLALYIGNDLEENLHHRPQGVYRGRLVSPERLPGLRAGAAHTGDPRTYIGWLVEGAWNASRKKPPAPFPASPVGTRSSIHRMLALMDGAAPGAGAADDLMVLARPLPPDPLLGPDARRFDPEDLYFNSLVPVAALAPRLAAAVEKWRDRQLTNVEFRRRAGMALAIEGTINAAQQPGWAEPTDFLAGWMGQVERYSQPPEMFDLRPALEATRRSLAQLAADVAADGAQLVVMLLPAEIQIDDGLVQALKQRHRDLPERWEPHWPQTMVVKLCRDIHLPVLDTTPSLAAWSKEQPLYLRYDTHLNAAGAFLVADLLAEYLTATMP